MSSNDVFEQDPTAKIIEQVLELLDGIAQPMVPFTGDLEQMEAAAQQARAERIAEANGLIDLIYSNVPSLRIGTVPYGNWMTRRFEGKK